MSGLLLYAAGFLLYAFANQSWMMYAITVVYCMGAIAGPALQGIIAGEVPPNAQGELQGAFSGLMSITSVDGSAAHEQHLRVVRAARRARVFPGAAMLLGAVLTMIQLSCSRAVPFLRVPAAQTG